MDLVDVSLLASIKNRRTIKAYNMCAVIAETLVTVLESNNREMVNGEVREKINSRR